MAEAFADKRYGNPAALHDRGERVAGRISGKRRYADLRGYPPEGIVALAYHLTDRYGRPETVLAPGQERENERIRASVRVIAPPLDYPLHLRAYNRPDHFRPAIGVHCFGADKTYLPIHYAAVFQEEHVPEIDTIAQIRKKP